MSDVVRLTGVEKTYILGTVRVPVLKGVELLIPKGEWVALMGPSGSGKSTLMNLIGLLDTPTKGTYSLEGDLVEAKSDDELSRLRNRHIGFVFQSFNLLPQLTALDNVVLPLIYLGMPFAERQERATSLLERMGLGDRMHHRPNALSGGEMQRVAMARALTCKPSLLLADEPTGNLDSKTGAEVLALMEEIHAEGATILMVTHEAEVAKRAQRTVHILDGVMA